MQAKQYLCFNNNNMICQPQVASVAVHSKAVVLSLMIHPIICGGSVCNAVLSLAIISLRKRALVALLK